MKQQDFNLLDDEKLIWACVEPIVLRVRGKDPGIKTQVIMLLSNAQRALFMFQVLYGHAHEGINRFFYQISYLADQMDIWSALKSSMEYFEEFEMLNFIEKMERAYEEPDAITLQLNNLYDLYQKLVPATLERIGMYIRNHQADFIQLED